MASVQHQAHLRLPPMARVRPPRILKGTPQANTNPQPSGEVPAQQVWVQGKWRAPTSNATKDRQLLQSRQVEKALHHETHGMNIYAYSHIRTNQVVYSLTKVMENNKIMPQLVYHRKKAVPSALRRDLWRPYFSIHFPQTPAGSQKGLRVYQMLRELSLKRQLSPSKEFLMTTPEDVERAKAKYDPANLHLLMKQHKIKLPNVGQLLPKKLRAKKLMDQKASSVADVAFALEQQETAGKSPLQWLQHIQAERKDKKLELSNRARIRLNKIRSEEAKKQEEISARQQLASRQDGNAGQLILTRHAAERISIEHQGVITSPGEVRDLKAVQEKLEQTRNEQLSMLPGFMAWKEKKTSQLPENSSDEKTSVTTNNIAETDAKFADTTFDTVNQSSRAVEIRWADARDATYASSWSENIIHDKLEPKAVAKKQISAVREHQHFDEDMNEIVEQKATLSIQTSSSPHIIGGRLSDKDLGDGQGWYVSPEERQKQAEQARKERVEQWETSKIVLAYRKSLALRKEMQSLEKLVSRSKQLREMSLNDPALSLLRSAQAIMVRLSFATDALEDLKAGNGKDREVLKSEIASYNDELLSLFDEVKSVLFRGGNATQNTVSRPEILSRYAHKLMEQLDFDRQYYSAKKYVDRYEMWSSKLNEREKLISKGEKLEKSKASNASGTTQTTNASISTDELQTVEEIQEAIVRLDQDFPAIAQMMQDEHDHQWAIESRKKDIRDLQDQIAKLNETIESLRASEDTSSADAASTQTSVTDASDPRLSSHQASLDSLKSHLVQLQQAQRNDHSTPDIRKRAEVAFVLDGKSPSNIHATSLKGSDKDQTLEELGIEYPEEKKGIWGRIKGLVGR